MDALFIIYLLSNSKGRGGTERNPHQELTMGSSVMLLTPHKADYFPWTLPRFPLSHVLCEKHED